MSEGLRVLFLVGLPILIVGALAGILAGSMQSATNINDMAFGYAARLLALAALGYLMLASFADGLIGLCQLALGT
ncbi:MAG: hypothetical protein DCC75_06280 [Proteobacteria bacterium]|nr:MAG: hypothetical protein DCC75_06280 [Pseudomonadota bacterium]